MTEDTEGLVLEQLRRIRASQERTEGDIHDLKVRMSAVENQLGQHQVQFSALNQRMDRIDERLGRIERRLDLVEA
ncbi:MAG: hypothetical protein AAGH60_14830 [Pseudomonadota bacterium]